jgi:hypothetical protein
LVGKFLEKWSLVRLRIGWKDIRFGWSFGKYREDFYFVDQFHGSALHDGECTACCKAHMEFADESA